MRYQVTKVGSSGRSALSLAMLAMLLALAGCSSSHGSHIAYIAGGSNFVSAFRIDDNSGVATPILASPFTTGKTPSSLAVHPAKLLYVANQGENTISRFKIDSTSGGLTEVLPRANTGISPIAITMDGGGTFLYVANQGSNSVSVFTIGSDGALSEAGSPYALAASPSGLTLTGTFLFVPVPDFSLIYVFAVNSGALTQVGSPVMVSDGISTLAADPQSKFLYAPNPSTNTVTGFAIQSGGGLIPVPDSPFATGTAPFAAAVNEAGDVLYVANSGATTVSQYMIDSSTGSLTAFSTATASVGKTPEFIVNGPGGTFVFVGNLGASSITELRLNKDGSLASSGNTIQLGFPPRSLAFSQ